jgi:hypothetical protein
MNADKSNNNIKVKRESARGDSHSHPCDERSFAGMIACPGSDRRSSVFIGV